MESNDDDVQRARHLCVVLRLRLKPDAVVDVLGEVLNAHESAEGKVRLQQLPVVVLPLRQIEVLSELHQVILHLQQHVVRVAVDPQKVLLHQGLAELVLA
eukprot:1019904-Pleurochrysis_carterae.AAC.1